MSEPWLPGIFAWLPGIFAVDPGTGGTIYATAHVGAPSMSPQQAAPRNRTAHSPGGFTASIEQARQQAAAMTSGGAVMNLVERVLHEVTPAWPWKRRAEMQHRLIQSNIRTRLGAPQ